jgi:iron complex outermembrane receptor protein
VSLTRTDSDCCARGVVVTGRLVTCYLLGILLGFWIGTAESEPILSTAIAPQPLAAALAEFAHQTGLQLVYVSQIAVGRTSKGARAGLPITEALAQLLDGNGLRFEFLNARTVRIFEPAAVAPASQSSATDVPKPRAEPPAHRLDALEEILVTGTRRVEHRSDLEDVQNIPASVSIVSGLNLEAEKAVQLSDYSSYLPGVNVFGGGMPGASGVAIRGVGPLNEATSVAFYLDDVPIGASGHWGYAGTTALDLLPYDLERLEVQRGPQGTFGGAGAEIGSIKYVLNPPNAREFDARVGADVSTIHGAAETGGSVRAMVNAPIVDDVFAIRATAYDSYTPGYIDNAYSGAKDINVLRQYGGRITALWRPSVSVSMTVTAFSYRIAQDSQTEVLSPGVAILPNTGDAYIVSGVGSYGDLVDSLAFLSPFKKNLDSYSATVRWIPGFAEVMSVTGWSRNHEHYVVDQTSIDGAYFPVLSGGAVPAGLAEFIQDIYLDKLTEELQIHSPSGKRLDWVLGGFYTRERFLNQGVEYAFDKAYQPIAAFAPNLGFTDRPSAFNEVAVFGDVTWEFSDQFDVVGGIRTAHNTQDYSTSATSGAYISGRSSDTATTWMTTARYRIEPRIMLYGRVATGSQPSTPLAPRFGTPVTAKGETATMRSA